MGHQIVMRLPQNIGPIILAVISQGSLVKSEDGTFNSRNETIRKEPQPSYYKHSAMKNCANYNHLSASIKNKIGDGSEEDKRCNDMIKDQSTLEFWEEFGRQK